MNIKKIIIIAMFVFMLPISSASASDVTTDKDRGWPRLIQKNNNKLTIYQPQIDSWADYADLHFRCAISLNTSASKKDVFGVAEIEAATVVDHNNRVVAMIPKKRVLRFPNVSEQEAAALRRVVDELHPPGQAVTISLDRVLAYLDHSQQQQQRTVELNFEPPKIFHSRKPAIMVIFLGEPQLKPVGKDRADLMFAINTNWDIFYDTTGQRYYLLNQDSWLSTADAIKGPWTSAGPLPAGLTSLPEDDNWADVRRQIPGKRDTKPPMVFTSTEPAELIITKGEPSYGPIPGTKLLRVVNTESSLFLHSSEGNFYFLTAGRWFRAAKLDGPWSVASNNLPEDFARIPNSNPAAYIKAAVPGTTEARDAVLLASVPTNTIIDLSKPATVQVTFNGQPQFQTIQGTTVQYAVNSPNQVFLVNGGFYACVQGIWFCGATANGPWAYCTVVPAAIYAIPPSHPAHNVTYVAVQSSTPSTVVYKQTAGYSGEYVAATGVLMFGAGMVAGAMLAGHHDHYYPSPAYYSYGAGARYSYATGGYYRSAQAYGPYGGAGAAASYNPRTGTYSRGAYAYGPAGSASARQAYNPYTGGRAAGAQVNTAYGSAGRAAAYNPNTGTAARGGYRSGEHGSAAAVQTNRGSGAAAWDTGSRQGAVAKDRQGNVYAGKDGNVYKKDSSGNWSHNTDSGWQSVNKPQTSTSRAQAGTTAQAQRPSTASVQSLNAQAQARQHGNQLSQRASGARSSYGSSGGRGGGMRGGRR